MQLGVVVNKKFFGSIVMIKYTAMLIFLHDSENWATRFLLTLMVFYSRKLDGKLKNIKKNI